MPLGAAAARPSARRPRLGFLGVGWIGRQRMKALVDTGAIDVAGIVEPSPEMAAEAVRLAPQAEIVAGIDGLLRLGVEGVVVATPSALHAEQCLRVLDGGAAVFCQKPLGRTAAEARAVVEAARLADRLLCVDLSYRHTDGMRRIHALINSGGLGRVYALDLVFHNAWGPDKPWFRDPALSGGGCLMDLGVHLVDLALWVLAYPPVLATSARLFSKGSPHGSGAGVEDYAVATLDLASDTVVRLACSWNLHAGREAVISAAFHGTEAGARFRNVDGSFYDFVAERHVGTEREVLTEAPEDWGGRAAVDWALRLARGEGFDPAADRLVDVADVLDRLYGR